jgi:DNA-directed RNA polymerase specialized sigma24 family protein
MSEIQRVFRYANEELVDNADIESATDPRLIAALRELAHSHRPHCLREADDLIERVLRTAIDEVDRRPARGGLVAWLTSIMARSVN